MQTVNSADVLEICVNEQAEQPDAAAGVDAVVKAPDGSTVRVPAFWARAKWTFRFSSAQIGPHSWEAVPSDPAAQKGAAARGEFFVRPDEADTASAHPGAVSVNPSGFSRADGSGFFWLADTWWMGLSKRLSRDEFQALAADRARRGFTVIQIVAGPYPDMEAFDERAANESGFSWSPGWSTINSGYYDAADWRIQAVVNAGLVPCIVGAWGYHINDMGVDKMKLHWRNLIARYAAYPVIWCLAGEAAMPFYNSATKEQDTAFQKAAWTQVARYVRDTDPFRRPMTIHPRVESAEEILDSSLIHFEMLQTGHSDVCSLPATVETVRRASSRTPRKPVVNAEVCYEGIGAACGAHVQRLMFWATMLSGGAGFTYGANGLWQINRPDSPYGPSPHGLSWGGPSWREAAALPGSDQVCIGRKVLEPLLALGPLEAHPEWVQGCWSPDNPAGAFAAGVPGKLRVIYWPSAFAAGVVLGLEPGSSYRATLISPIDGATSDLGAAVPDETGRWEIPCGNVGMRVMPVFQDWVLVLQRL